MSLNTSPLAEAQEDVPFPDDGPTASKAPGAGITPAHTRLLIHTNTYYSFLDKHLQVLTRPSLHFLFSPAFSVIFKKIFLSHGFLQDLRTIHLASKFSSRNQR